MPATALRAIPAHRACPSLVRAVLLGLAAVLLGAVATAPTLASIVQTAVHGAHQRITEYQC